MAAQMEVDVVVVPAMGRQHRWRECKDGEVTVRLSQCGAVVLAVVLMMGSPVCLVGLGC